MTFKSKGLAAVLLGAGLGLLGGERSAGYSYYQLNGIPVTWRDGRSARYLSPSTFPPHSDPDVQIRSAMGAWNLVPASDFLYSYIRLDHDPVIDHFDGYSDTAAVPAWQLDPGVLGVTYLVNSGGEWFDADIVFSDLPAGVGYNFDLYPDCDVISQPIPNHGFSFLLIALHELGHGLGLGHDPIGTEPPNSPWGVATMNPRYPSGGPVSQENIIELHTNDRNGVRYLYPHAGPSEPPQRDLALAAYTAGPVVGRAVPIFFSPETAAPAESLRLRSGVENFGTTHEFAVRQGFYLSRDTVIDHSDAFLGALYWDIAFQDAFGFEVDVPLPDDWPAGSFYLGSILDDLDEVPEVYEDNNAALYCVPLTVEQMSPSVQNLGQRRTACGQLFTGPTPSVTHPLNMVPLTWSLDNPEPGMTIDRATGVISWPRPAVSPFLYTLYVRAANGAGSDSEVLYLGVDPAAPRINAIASDATPCHTLYTGPQPQLSSPECMNPILLWSLVSAPAGMTIHPATGVVGWLNPVPSATPYRIEIRAVNGAGGGTQTWYLTVKPGDASGDGRTDLLDAAILHSCLTGPAGVTQLDCRCSDADSDNDIDLADVAAFLRHFGG